MRAPTGFRIPAWLVPLALCSLIVLPSPAWSQEPRAQHGEIKAVARISRQLIDDAVVRKEVVAAVPYQAKVMGFWCQGVIDGQATRSVDMTAAENDGVFIVNGQGTARTDVRGVRGPIVATGTAWGPFTTRTLVRFDGRKFFPEETIPWSEVHGQLNTVEGRRGGPIGRAGGRLLRPLGEKMVPRAEKEAAPIGNAYLTSTANEMAVDIVARLNRTAPVEASLNRLFPETKDWVVQLSTDPQFIQAAYGPRDIAVPTLPENPGRPRDVRLELWLRTTTKEAQALVDLTKKPLAKQLVQRYIEATLPELAAVTEERTVTAVGEWLVISIGAPKAD